MRSAVVCASLLVSGMSLGTPGAGDTSLPSAVVAVDTIPDIELSPGDTATVAVSITVAEGFHVQANPASGEFLIPLELKIAPVEGLAFGRVDYPTAIPFRLDNSEETLQTYEKTFTVNVHVIALQTGNFHVDGALRYQACDSKRCLFPSNVPFEFSVVVRRSKSKGAEL